MKSRFGNDSLIYEEAMSQPISMRPPMSGRNNQQGRPGFNISQRRALVVTNPNQRLFQMPKPKNAKVGQSEIKEIDLDDLLGGCTETPEAKKPK